MTTRKLLEYVNTQAEKFGWEIQVEETGLYNENGSEQHLWLSKDEYEMEFYYYIKPKNDGYSITNTPLTRNELGDGCEIITYEYTNKEEIDEYFRTSGPSLEELRNNFLNMFNN